MAEGEARAAYASAHGGEFAGDAHALAPYFRNPADAATAIADDALQRAITDEFMKRFPPPKK